MKKATMVILVMVAIIFGVYVGNTKTYADAKNEAIGIVQDYELRKVLVNETEGEGDIILDRHDLGNYTVYWHLSPEVIGEDADINDAMFIFEVEFDSIDEIGSENVTDINAVIDGKYYTWKQMEAKGWIS